MNHEANKNGFTLIELMLAMSFVSMLLIAIALTVVQIGNIYNQGLTLKDVNQAGRSIASELQRSISQSEPFNIKPGVGSHYIQQGNVGSYWGGRLCIGQYSYIWNYGSAISNGNQANMNVYSNSSNQILFVKVIDPSASYCLQTSKKVDINNATELLNVGQHNLAVHSFNVTAEASAGDSKTGQQLYSFQFLIGTNEQSALVLNPNTGMLVCKAPGQSGSDPAYCSVSEFNIEARAGNAVQ
jgi:type II secretory pathway pseudopilin PulG